MYLELSRPRGEVGRWPKVYERLLLFNEFSPVKQCKISRSAFRGGLSHQQVNYTLNFIIENKRIFAGADLLHFYNTALKTKKKGTQWIFSSKKPIIFFSPDILSDSKILREEFSFLNKQGKKQETNDSLAISNTPITIKTYTSRGVDLIPSMKVITHGKKSLVFIIDQTACHSYFNIPLADSKVMRIASMDTLITLYFGLGLIDSNFYDMGSMECLANNLVKISIESRKDWSDDFAFPFISIKCAGHQTSLPSLIRAKVKRITQKKLELTNILKNKPKYRRKTVRNKY
jgi:hypothetical protein